MGAGRCAGDRVGAREARRGRAAAAHDRGDPGPRWRDAAGPGRADARRRTSRTRRRSPGERATSSRSTSSARAISTAGCASTRSTRSTWPPTVPGSRSSKTAATSACSRRCTRCGAATACRAGSSSTTAARSSRRPASARSCRVLPAPGRHAGVRPAPRAVAQRHDRALQRHLRQALLPPGALQRSRTPRQRAGAFERFHNSQHRYSATNAARARQTAPRRSAPLRRSPRSPPAGPAAGRSSSSASSAPTTSCGCSAARSRCPTAAPTSTSPPRSTSRSPSDDHNLLVCDDHGELLTTARLRQPAPLTPRPTRTRVRPPLRLALRAPRLRAPTAPLPLPTGNDVLAATKTQREVNDALAGVSYRPGLPRRDTHSWSLALRRSSNQDHDARRARIRAPK